MAVVDDSLQARLSTVAALTEPTRRRLYDHVVHQPDPVTRDEAAAACALPRATAAFHLDRLADEGLLDVVYQRRTGRSGPGAGRPSKLYRRSNHQVEVSLPERHYDLVGRLLAAAIEDAEHSGDAPRTVLYQRAHQLGERLGETAAQGDGGSEDTVLHVLADQGFEPRAQGSTIVLGNCPFYTLAQEHPEIVCGMNLNLLEGLLGGLAATTLDANLVPAPGYCCVRVQPSSG